MLAGRTQTLSTSYDYKRSFQRRQRIRGRVGNIRPLGDFTFVSSSPSVRRGYLLSFDTGGKALERSSPVSVEDRHFTARVRPNPAITPTSSLRVLGSETRRQAVFELPAEFRGRTRLGSERRFPRVVFPAKRTPCSVASHKRCSVCSWVAHYSLPQPFYSVPSGVRLALSRLPMI